ncbi:MAG: TolC family protein [Proteobacteria bacterium]|nr:TolC family protein [Pseudomonadota bacterium]
MSSQLRAAGALRLVLGLCVLVGLAFLTPARAGAEVEGARQAPGAPRLVTLEEAYRLAQRDNPTLAVMAARVRSAAAEVGRAWSQLKPSASLNGTYTVNDPVVSIDAAAFAPPGAPPSEPIVIQRRHQFAFALQAGVPLFRGPAYQQLGVARKGVAAAQLRGVRRRQDYLLRVADAYYAGLGTHEVATALEEKVAVDQRNLAVVRARLEVGRVLRSDVVRAELVLVQDEQALRRQRNALAAAQRRVAILIGLDGLVTLRRPAEPAPVAVDEAAMLRSAVRRRADVEALRLDIAAADQASKAVRWSFLPTLDLNLLYRWQNVGGFANRRDSLAVVATLGLPLYEGGLRYANQRAAEARMAEGRAARAELTRGIAETVVQLRADLLSAEAGLVSADKAASLATVIVEEMTARYEAGTATQLDLLDATQRRLEARIELTRSRYARDMARVALAHVLGGRQPFELEAQR